MYTKEDEVFVLTRDSFGEFAKVHHRMPVLLEENEIDLWIDTKKYFNIYIYFFLSIFHDIIDKKILNQQK